MKLFVSIYDDARLLSRFLAHYRSAGVTEFFIAVAPALKSAAAQAAAGFEVTLLETPDVQDSFTGGAVAVTEMRRRFQGLSEWVVIVDLDEFVEFPGDISGIIDAADREGANVVRAIMWDRFSRDGRLVSFEPRGDLRHAFPIRARFIKDVMQGTDYKGVLVKGVLESLVAHHEFADQQVASQVLDLSHYKWFDGAIERVGRAHRMLSDAGRSWTDEYQRVLDHYATYGRFAWEEFGGELDPLCAAAEETAAALVEPVSPPPLAAVIETSAVIPGWTRGGDAAAVAAASFALGADAVIVEIGVFLGCCTVLLAGARRLRGNGVVHCVDPFDASGDAFSLPYYREILDSLGAGSLRQHFDANIAHAGLAEWIAVHPGRATDIAAGWSQPIDLLLLDGDQSPEGARAAYQAWEPLLKPGGTIVLRNTRPRAYAAGHDGHRRLAVEEIVAENYVDIRQIEDTTVARKRERRAGAAAPAKERMPRVHLYAQCWNDAPMLPYFFRHCDPVVERYVIFDDGSSDQSREILAAHPKVELRRFVRSDPTSFALSEQALSNEFWKESRGSADWVIVTDIDEHLYHAAMPDYLRACGNCGVTLIPALGFQMIGEELPGGPERLCDAVRRGAPFDDMMKISLFRPGEIEEINFELGRHRAAPVGNLRVPHRDELLLLHYKYLGLTATQTRHAQLQARLGETDVASRWGYQYEWSPAELAAHWQSFAKRMVDVRGMPSEIYPLPRWWLPGMRTAAVNGRDVAAEPGDRLKLSPAASKESFAAMEAEPSPPGARPQSYRTHFLYIADALRRTPHRVDAEPDFFEFHGNDLFLHPPAAGSTYVTAHDIAPGAVRAVCLCAFSLDEKSASPVRFRLLLADMRQTLINEVVIQPGETREIQLFLNDFDAPLSFELSTELADGSGNNYCAWATIREPRIQYLLFGS